jgi:hypothetical protein
MSHDNTVFNQLLHLLPRHEFEKLVAMHGGDRYVKNFTCWRQFMTLLYAQIRGHDSLRDIVTGLGTQSEKWYHIGLGYVARSTLSDANNTRDWRIFEGLFYEMLNRCAASAPAHAFKFKNPLFSMDATVIELCLSVFEWAKFRKTKGALKIHCLLDHQGCIPAFAVVTDGKCHDVKAAKEAFLPLMPDSILAVDRGYIDFEFLYSIHSIDSFFVTRAKNNLSYEVTGQHNLPNKKGLLDDVAIRLTGYYQRKSYPDELRLITWHDAETGKIFWFLTNNFKLSASTIAAVYKSRWQIELFFKWIKQNLKIKSFLGATHNAVMTQIWVAMCYFLLLAYVKFQTRYRFSFLHLARLFKETLLDRISLIHLLSLNPEKGLKCIREPSFQLALF